jgi:hypothetical protein
LAQVIADEQKRQGNPPHHQQAANEDEDGHAILGFNPSEPTRPS